MGKPLITDNDPERLFALGVVIRTLENYQLRPPPPLPPRSPRYPPPPPPPPPPRERCSIGRASLTVSERPPKSLPFHISIAFCASSSEVISTKPNPLERPLILSMMITALSTAPACEKASLSSASVVL